MNVLERADPAWVFPATPALEEAVLARLARRPRRRRRLVLALAATVLLLAASAVAGPPLLDRLGLGAVELRWADRLPPTTARRPLDFGERVTLARARELAPFRLRVPTVDDLDRPTAVYHRGSTPGDMVTLVYEADGEPRLVLSQWRSQASQFEKVLPHETRVMPVQVGDGEGVWIGGGGHAVWYQAIDGSFPQERFALAARTLLWRRGEVSYRLEADVPLTAALRIARSLR